MAIRNRTGARRGRSLEYLLSSLCDRIWPLLRHVLQQLRCPHLDLFLRRFYLNWKMAATEPAAIAAGTRITSPLYYRPLAEEAPEPLRMQNNELWERMKIRAPEIAGDAFHGP